MRHGIATNTKVLAIGLGALLAPVLVSGPATADPDHHHHTGGGRPAPIPPTSPSAVTSELLARGAAGEFDILNNETGIHLLAEEPTDVALVRATLAPFSSTGWHEHDAESVVIVASGTLRMIEPKDGRSHGCTTETFAAGTALAHRSRVHNFANLGSEPVVFYIAYFVPEGGSPAPIPADPPRGC